MKEKNEVIACRRKTSIGGQALMEGIMMRGPKMTAMAVRNTQGEIIVEEFETTTQKRPAFCRWPIIRGVLGYVDSMTLGYKCLMRSAELSGLEDIVEEKPKKKKNKKSNEEATSEAVTAEETKTEEETKKESKTPAWVMGVISAVSVVLGFALAIGLFMLLPTFLYGLLAPVIEGENLVLNSLMKSAFEGILKVVLLVAYMAAISLMKDIRRT